MRDIVPQVYRGSNWASRQNVRKHSLSYKRRMFALQQEFLTLWFILQDVRTRWYSRTIAAFSVGYIFSPLQLIPSFIPVIGMLDDVAMLWAGGKLVRWLTAETVFQDAQTRAREISRTSLGTVGHARLLTSAMALIALWLAIAITAALAILA